VPADALAAVTTWFTGAAFASSANRPLAVGWAVIRGAVSAVTGAPEAAFRQVYLKHSDTGETVAELFAARAGAPGLALADVRRLFDDLFAARGPTQKQPLLAAALAACGPAEAKFLAKILTGDLRIGLKEGLLEDAVARAFGAEAAPVRGANQLLGDFGRVAELARAGRLADASIEPLRPVKVMLASPEPTAAAVLGRVREWQAGATAADAADGAAAAWLEDKYDGIRCQLHKHGDRAVLFSRELKDVTATFPELEAAARRLPGDVILDGEALAMAGDRALPFGELQKRLGRRERDLFLGGEIPVRFLAFDLLWADGRSWLAEPLRARRRRLEALPLPAEFGRARVVAAGTEAEVAAAFAAARAAGHEGLLIKDPASPYLPGRRGLAWLKLKQALATLDCVVVGAEYGHGKRHGVLSDYTFAVRDERTGALQTIGKAYSGLTDAEIAHLTAHFLARVRRQRGRYHEVTPDVVLEIAFDSLQPSKRHESGLAMRFPRIARLRTDKTPAEIDTVATARRLAGIG
jgi:DNA ligase 1